MFVLSAMTVLVVLEMPTSSLLKIAGILAQEKSSVRSAMFIGRITNNDPPSSVGAACSPSAYAKLDARACHAAPTELGWIVDDLGCYKHGAPRGAWRTGRVVRQGHRQTSLTMFHRRCQIPRLHSGLAPPTRRSPCAATGWEFSAVQDIASSVKSSRTMNPGSAASTA